MVRSVLNVLQEYLKLKNFNGVMTVVSALQQIPIYRLKRTWEVCTTVVEASPFIDGSLSTFVSQRTQLLPSKIWDTWDALYALMDSAGNFQTYREALEKAAKTPPCVPYLGAG